MPQVAAALAEVRDQPAAVRGRAVERWCAVAVAGVALALAVWAHWSTLTNPYVVNDDAHQHTFWMHRFRDPSLFPGDVMAEYARRYQPWGYTALYRVASLVADPTWVARVLPLGLFAASAVLVHAVVRRFAGPWAALISAGVFTVSPFFLEKMAGGHPRAFATPLLLLTLLELQRPRPLQLGLVLAVQSVLYPMAFMLSAGTALLSAVRLSDGRLALERRRLAGVLAGVAVGGLALIATYGPSDEVRGPIVRRESMSDPVFHAGGRDPHLPTPPVLAAAGDALRTGLFRAGNPTAPRTTRLQLAAVLALAVVVAALTARARMRAPVELAWLLAVSIALFWLADALMMRLFIPRRYLMYSLPLVAVIVIGPALDWLVERIRHHGPRAALRAGLLAALILQFPGLRDVGLNDYSAYGSLFRYLATVPRDAVIASHPNVADGFHVFARRVPFVSFEMSLPYYQTYWREIQGRLDALFDAYYASSLAPVASFCRRFGVDYLVVDQRYFNPRTIERGAYFEPFGTRIRERAGGRSDFALSAMPGEDKLFRSHRGRVFVVGCDAVERLAEEEASPAVALPKP